MASSQSYLCFVAWLSGDVLEADLVGSAALAEFRRVGNLREVAAVLVSLGAAATYRGETDLAAQRLEEALALARRLGYQEAIAWSLHELAILGRRRRRSAHEIELMLRDALLAHQQLGDRWRVASVLEEIAGSVLARRDASGAIRLLAAARRSGSGSGRPCPRPSSPTTRRRSRACVAGSRRRRTPRPGSRGCS
ncbi:MAG TPA: hypothetical protein VII87_08695 [Solirubrobacteraceae bacterium]